MMKFAGLRRLADAIEGRLDVFGGEFGTVVELHPLAQHEGIGLAVLGDVPAVRQVGDDGLAAVARVASDQVVELHRLRRQAVDRARLVHVEMRRAHRDAVAQDAARFRVGFRRRELELGAVELQRDVGQRPIGPQAPGGRGHRRAAAQHGTPAQMPPGRIYPLHVLSSPQKDFSR